MWVQFRARRISELVKRISTHIRKVAPKVKISAAVFTRWPGCIEGNGQDWGRWCREGWLDFVCPMNYTLDPEDFVKCAASHRKAVGPGFPIAEGIGINSGSGAMRTPGQLAAHIALARKSGAIGWVGFCYRPKQTTKLFAPLKDWIEAKPQRREPSENLQNRRGRPWQCRHGPGHGVPSQPAHASRRGLDAQH